MSAPVDRPARQQFPSTVPVSPQAPRTLRDAVLLDLWPKLDGYSKAEANLITDAVVAVLRHPDIARALATQAAVDGLREWGGTVCSACEIAHNEVIRRIRVADGGDT